MKNRDALIRILSSASVADPPTFHFDADSDPAFHIKTQNIGKVLK
jgi:hypothetical protein